MRMLVLCHEGAPMRYSATPGPIRALIREWPADDADLWQIWEVPPAESGNPSRDITAQFAETWAMEFEFADGERPEQYLRFYPAFIREAAGKKLEAKWAATRAATEQGQAA